MAIEQGLAAQGQQQQIEMAVGEIIKMLQNGANPDELVQQGIPPELIQLAMEQISQGAQTQNEQQMMQPQTGMQQMGLAQS